jgi:hypothetical protein
MEWQRVYKMGIAISSNAHFEMERGAQVLRATYQELRTAAGAAKRMVEFAHRHRRDARDLPRLVVASTTCRAPPKPARGYSPKMATLQRSYEDVIQLFGKSGRYLTPSCSARRNCLSTNRAEGRSALQAVSRVDAAAGRADGEPETPNQGVDPPATARWCWT